MNKIIFLTASFFLPLADVFAHNGINDGDSVVAVSPSADERTTVAVGLVLIVLLIALVIWWLRRKQ